jgi:hypothetical protein
MSDYGFLRNAGEDGPDEPVSDYGLGRLVIPPVQKVGERPVVFQEGIPRAQLDGIGALADLGQGVFSFFESKVLGIPLWAIGLGVGAYFVFFAGKGKKKTRMADNDNDYEYED